MHDTALPPRIQGTRLPTARNVLIDLLRGIALVFIVVDHINLIARHLGDIGSIRLYFLIDLQMTDAAEFFVFFSGYVFGLVHSAEGRRKPPVDLLVAAVRRTLQIFAAYAVTIVVIGFLYATITQVYTPSARWVEVSGINVLHHDGIAVLQDMATLYLTVFFLNILHLYILLLLFAVPMLLLWQRLPLVAVGVSGAIWLWAQFVDTSQIGTWAGIHAFFPPGWQLLFCVGLFMGSGRLLEHPALPARGIMFTLACITLLAGFLLRQSLGWVGDAVLPDMLHNMAAAIPGTWKPALGIVRLINFAALVYVILALAPSSVRLAGYAPARWVAVLGQNSLEMFCVGSVMIFLVSLAIHAAGGGVLVYGAVLTVAMVLYLLAGQLVARLRRKY